MAADEEIPQADEAPAARRPRWPLWLGGAALALGLGLGWVWLTRKEIADDYLAGQLQDMGLPATYKVDRVGPTRQVLKGVTIGDPGHPDFTAEEVSLEVNYTFGIPSVGRITLVRPRLYGAMKQGRASFGSLDKLIYTDSKAPFRLPELDLAVVDGRGLLVTEQGPVGFKLDGKGALRDGFEGTVAAVAPNLAFGDCRASGASAYGAVRVRSERPEFDGPLRLASLDCPKHGIALAQAAIATKAQANRALDAVEADLSLKTGRVAMNGLAAAESDGTVRASWKAGALTARYDLGLAVASGPELGASTLRTEGLLRAADGLARIEAEGTASGSGIALGDGLDTALASAERSAEGSFAAPMLAQVRAALKREAPGSALAASYTLRQTGGVTNLTLPQASLTGGSGATLLALSRVHFTQGASGGPRLAGNFVTGGAGLPRLSGRMERRAGGLFMNLAMAEYAAGGGRLAVPELVVAQGPGGALGFAGQARLTGKLPGGLAEGLVLPVEGNWSPGGGLAVWRKCTPVRFARLQLAYLTLVNRSLTLCPGSAGAIVRSDGRGTRIAAGTAPLALDGTYSGTPIRVRGGSLGLAWPGSLAGRDLDIALGGGEVPHRFTIARLDGQLGQEVSGTFAGLGAKLAGVPLDLGEGAGRWHYGNSALSISQASFVLTDRQALKRFNPLIARDADLVITGGIIDAHALLREPSTGREVTRAAIRHDLHNGHGFADLFVDGIRFDKQLQPIMISELTSGVIALADGTVTGRGRIDWTPEKVTSTGDFATDRLDFAAAFGPTKGLSGKVHFTDLIGLVTAPDQRFKIASINPGIEANDGELSFEMRPDSLLVVNGAKWPFLDGELVLEPTRMVLGAAETRRFTMVITGLDAAKFLQRLDMANLSATGTFDGRLPLVFDENGGRIEGGVLASRPPGGNVSYVGQLTYKDLSPMANFAFDALKSIDYKGMKVELDGALAGEIVTRVSFDGISQGAGARRNFLTRQVAKLPLRFNVNVRAPFFGLITSMRSLYDPNYIPDPREKGLVGADGKPVRPLTVPPTLSVQPPVSEKKP